MKKLIYTPALSTGVCAQGFKNNTIIKDDVTCRFYDKQYEVTHPDFYYPYFLLSSGNPNQSKFNYNFIDLRQQYGLEDSFVVGDSGGYQIATGKLKFNPEIRKEIVNWLENNCDVAINIDIPVFPGSIYENDYKMALKQSLDNFEFVYDNQQGKTKFLNVLQPRTVHEETNLWYNTVKHLEFNGWAIGGKPSVEKMLYAIALLLENGEYNKPKNQYCHVLGVSGIDKLFILTAVQKQLNKYCPHVQLTCDSSSPGLSAIYGGYYSNISLANMAVQSIKFLKKISHDENSPLPCPINCFVCKDNTLKSFNNFEKGHEQLIITCHNVAMLANSMVLMDKYMYHNEDVLRELLTADYFKTYLSIEEMFSSGKPMETFYKYKSLYNQISRMGEIMTDGAVSNTFFDFD